MVESIGSQLQAYADGDLDLATFEERFVPATWHIDPERDSERAALVARILAFLLEVKSDDLTESDFRVVVGMVAKVWHD